MSRALAEAFQSAAPIDGSVAGDPNDIVAIDIFDFIQREIPPREMVLAPFLPSQGLAMIYAERGLGKTWLTLEIAYAVACGGSYLKWHAPCPRRVLLLDREMPAVALQERLNLIVRSNDREAVRGMLTIITPDFQERGMPDISTSEGQARLARFVEQADLVILDNLSTLCRTGRENDAESWTPIQEWALRLRRVGKSVLFVHHSNKNGGQRGSIRKEDVLDSVVALRKPEDYSADDGARLEVHFDKHRGFHGEDAKPSRRS